jgi:hypothetical protein
VQEAVENLIKRLVSEPDAVEVEASQERGATLVRVRVAQVDMGKLIGREGKTIRALRSLLHAAGQKSGQRIVLEILE